MGTHQQLSCLIPPSPGTLLETPIYFYGNRKKKIHRSMLTASKVSSLASEARQPQAQTTATQPSSAVNNWTISVEKCKPWFSKALT